MSVRILLEQLNTVTYFSASYGGYIGLFCGAGNCPWSALPVGGGGGYCPGGYCSGPY